MEDFNQLQSYITYNIEKCKIQSILLPIKYTTKTQTELSISKTGKNTYYNPGQFLL
jgi:tRNA U34 2-thiouridine synthase MnmA/TrmU